jgi:hypothetical protein
VLGTGDVPIPTDELGLEDVEDGVIDVLDEREVVGCVIIDSGVGVGVEVEEEELECCQQ